MGKYDSWDRYFADLDGEEHELTFVQMEELLDGTLPESAFEHHAWWSNSQNHAEWTKHGWYAHADLRNRIVRFDRTPTQRGRPRNPRPWDEPDEHDPKTAEAPELGEARLVLVGCVAQKRSEPTAAKDLYTSDLWTKRRTYAESTGKPWMILSAEHGLVDPDRILEPYDRYLESQPASYREQWSRVTAQDVISTCRETALDSVEIHAGAAYIEHGLKRALEGAGLRVLRPLRGLRIGEQLAWYLNHGPSSGPGGGEPSARSEEAEPLDADRARSSSEGVELDLPEVVSMHRIGPFEWRWPDSTEAFDHGWEGELELGGRRIRFRHGVGQRQVYGRERVHTVTWLNGEPVVEGSAVDTYAITRSLASTIKNPDGTMVRATEQLSPMYGVLDVVDHRTEIDAPYSRSGLAVKIRVDDVAGWLVHALARRSPAEPSGRQQSERRQPRTENGPLPAVSPEQKRAVAQALADFAPRAKEMAGDVEGASFADDPEANRLLAEDPFAFLLAVIADYQIPAERAWALPHLLKQRLGHLDPAQMLAEPEALGEAVAQRPSLHRYVKNVPAFFLAACGLVINEYGGDAGQIWAGNPTAVQLQRRLQQFPGISQKKAAMADEILERDFGVPIREMHGSDIAFDVHIRRVFLRSGLAEIDDQDHMIEAARTYWPNRPGLLDLPSWVIGRNWCRPTNPDCGTCAISSMCAQRIEAAEEVRGA